MPGAIEGDVHDRLLDLLTDEQLEGLGDGLRHLRVSYNRGRPPDFSRDDVRGAYAVGYHPAHTEIAVLTYISYGARALGLDGSTVRAVCLGAGAGAEADALVRYLADLDTPPEHVMIDLVDREYGWKQTRGALTLRRLDDLAEVSGFPLDVTTHVHDLTDGVDTLEGLLGDADLVTAQTVLSEIHGRDAQQSVLAEIAAAMGVDTRLLLLDLHAPKAGAAALTSIPAGVRRYAPIVETHTLNDPPDRLQCHFWQRGVDWMRPRRSIVYSAVLLGHPGRVRTRPQPAVDPTADQQAALHQLAGFLSSDMSQVAILTGDAGTGKTWLAQPLSEIAEDYGLQVALLAPTGQAARRLGHRVGRPASTIHSTIYRYQTTESDSDATTVTAVFTVALPEPTATLWIIDEASMIGDVAYADRDDTEDADALVRFHNGKVLSDLLTHALAHPASRLLFIGDPNQLPPVEDGTASPALDAEHIANRTGHSPLLLHLHEVMRQSAGSPVLELARRVLGGGQIRVAAGAEDLIAITGKADLPDNVIREVLTGNAAVLTHTNDAVADWNVYLREAAGRGLYLPEPGDRLLVVRPDQRLGLVNGTELTVVDVISPPRQVGGRLGRSPERFTTQIIDVLVDLDTRVGAKRFTVTMCYDLLLSAHKNRFTAIDKALRADVIRRTTAQPGSPAWQQAALHDDVFCALRATYAYARTVHRGQGSEWNRVVLDATSDAGRRWRYTAVTRAKEGLWVLGATRAQFTAADAQVDITRYLTDAGLTVTDARAHQHEQLNLTVTDGTHHVRVTLDSSGGRPRRVRRNHHDDASPLDGRVLQLLRTWMLRLRERLDPPPDNCDGWVTAIRQHATHDGIPAVGAYCHANFKVAVACVTADGTHTEVLIDHRGDGTPTHIEPTADCRDSDLADLVRRAVSSL